MSHPVSRGFLPVSVRESGPRLTSCPESGRLAAAGHRLNRAIRLLAMARGSSPSGGTRLEVGAARRAWERDDVADIGHAGDHLDGAL